MSNFLIVSYYTIGTPYEKEAKATIQSCEKFGLRHAITGVPNLGSWQSNTRYKAIFMKEMLEKHAGERLLWVDCDAVIQQYPTLMDSISADIALRYQDFRYRKGDCLSGTIYMESNARTLALCDRWIQYNNETNQDNRNIEQWNLDRAIQEMIKEHGLRFENLPPEYTFIFDLMRKIYPDAKPVIEHFQASRKYRNLIK